MQSATYHFWNFGGCFQTEALGNFSAICGGGAFYTSVNNGDRRRRCQ